MINPIILLRVKCHLITCSVHWYYRFFQYGLLRMIFTLSVASKSFSFRDSPHYENKSSIKQVTQTKTLNRKANSRNYLMGSEWFARSTILIHVHAIHTIYGISSGRPLHFPSTCLIREQKVEANAIRLEKGTFSRTCTALSFVARKSA